MPLMRVRAAELAAFMVSMLLVVQPVSPAASADRSAANSAARSHEGPYAAIGNMLSDDKAKSRFFGLLKKMKNVNKDVAEPLRNSTRRALNSEVQKLLGDATYQKFRKARMANTAKAKGSGTGSSSIVTLGAAPMTGGAASHGAASAGKAKGKGKGKPKGKGAPGPA